MILYYDRCFSIEFLSFFPIKVRSMWALIIETFMSLKKEMEIVDSGLEGRVDQYVFDGTNVDVNVPHLLVDKVESGTQEVSNLCLC